MITPLLSRAPEFPTDLDWLGRSDRRFSRSRIVSGDFDSRQMFHAPRVTKLVADRNRTKIPCAVYVPVFGGRAGFSGFTGS